MLRFCLVAFVLLRLGFWFNTFPNPDESYYWLWGQHPDWSYYDHPPLAAWVQGAFTALFGRSHVVLRLPNLITTGIFFYTYYRICRYLYRQDAVPIWRIVVLLVLASPLYFLFLALAWHDHLLITFALIAAYLFIRFLDGYLTDGRGETWRLYGSAAAIALAILCKYSIVFVLFAFAATLIADKRLRPLWRDYRLYLAGAIAATGLIPILLWNVSNDFQSFQYYFNRSVNPASTNSGGFSLKWGPCLNFLLFSWLLVSPFNWVYFWRGWRQRDRTIPAQSTYPVVAAWIFLISTVTLTVVSLLSAALYYWNILAYLLLFPLAGATITGNNKPGDRAPLFISTQFLGLLFAALLVIHYSILPLSALASKTEDPDSRMLFGWQEVATAVQRETATLGQNPLLITTDYRSAAALAYQLQDKSVTAISDRIDQFDFWYGDRRSFRGRNAVILSDDWHPLPPDLLANFARTSSPITVPVTRFGIWIKNYYLVVGYDWKTQ